MHPQEIIAHHCTYLDAFFLSSVLLLPTTTMISLSSSSTSTLPKQKSINRALQLLESVYGPIASPDFPLPMRSSEAGPCQCSVQCSSSSSTQPREQQHRYLWTDAFAVLAYQTLADSYKSRKNENEAKKYRDAVEKLIAVVHDCLGKPRSEREKDGMTPCTISPTGYVGLRIGKEESRKTTDYGMNCDGQYWHYIDKWLFVLARTGHAEEGVRIAKSCFPYFFSSSKYGGGGIRWKLSVDASPPPSLPPVYGPNDDTLNALIVFSMLEKQNQSIDDKSDDESAELNLRDEIALLQNSLRNYKPQVTSDPLGWGLEVLFDQFIQGHPRMGRLRKLAPEVLDSVHLSLPFRLYGSLIGALVVPSAAADGVVSVGGSGGKRSTDEVAIPRHLRELLDYCTNYQFLEMRREESSDVSGYKEDHSSINRTMLAMALLAPGVLRRRGYDPLVHL